MQSEDVVPAQAAHWQSVWLGVGVVGVLACIAGAVMSLDQFLRGYLIAYMFWLGLSMGCLALLMVQYLSGGFWGLSIRSTLEAATKGLPLMAVLFVPIALGRHHLYAWMSDPELTARNSWYLHTGGFGGWFARAIIYFVLWIGLATILTRRGERLYKPLSGALPHFQGISGVGALVYALSISFASVDWVMSLDPHWGSTIYGLIFVAGQGLSALAFSVIILTLLTRYSPYREIIKPTQFHDLGKLMFAFVMLFAYFSFSQWLIIWAGNLPEEIGWFLNRIHGGWGVVALVIILFHFALPFCLLLSRATQASRKPDDRHCGVPDVHAGGGHLLVRSAELRPRARTLLSQHLVRHTSDCYGRTLAGLFLLQPAAAAVVAALRSTDTELLTSRIGTWPLITTLTILCAIRRSITTGPT